MNTEATVNLNQAQCLRTISHWGYDKVYNICNGSDTVLPWGLMDYLGLVGIGIAILVGLAFVAFLAGFALMVIRDSI